MTRTKIVATVGPACSDIKVLRELAFSGVDVFRLNFSHGAHETHAATVEKVREVSRMIDHPLAILADISGPKLRIGEVAGDGVILEDGDTLVLTTRVADGTDNRFQVNFKGFNRVAKAGDNVLLDDGNIALRVREVDGQDVRCQVLKGAKLTSRKGVNLPDTTLPLPAMSEKDEADMAFALEQGVDLVALSFVRQPKDVTHARAVMKKCGREVPLLAKIEKAEAVRALEEVLAQADGAMVARGDLGIEMPMEQVPAIQKRVIAICNRMGKPVITATQMLDSMIRNPIPTRAEVTDIYNAILDGTDAVMLSGETAMGQFPIEAVQMMEKVAREAENHVQTVNRDLGWLLTQADERPSITQAVSSAVCQIARQLHLEAILVATQTGGSARSVSRFRPACPIYAFSPDSSTVNQLCLSWGVEARVMEIVQASDEGRAGNSAVVNATLRTAKDHGLVKRGARVAVIAGFPLGVTGSTNYLRVVEVD